MIAAIQAALFVMCVGIYLTGRAVCWVLIPPPPTEVSAPPSEES